VSEEQSAESAATPMTPSAEPLKLDEAGPTVPRQPASDGSADAAETVKEGAGTPLPSRPTDSATMPPPVAEPAVPPPAEPPPLAEPATPPPLAEPATPPPAEPPPLAALAAPKAPQATPEPAAPKAPEAAPGSAEPVAVVVTLPAEKRGRGPVLTLLIAIAVLAVLAIVGYFVVQRIYADPTRDATAGDCLTSLPAVDPGQDKEASGARVVECGDPTASHRVEGRLDNQSTDQARNLDICKGYPEATFIYRAVPDSGNGYVLCLKKLTP
jgi:hypothetical protein